MGHVFAIDLGGTDTKFAVVNQQGNIVAKDKHRTPGDLICLITFIQEQLKTFSSYLFEGIAISSPGAVSDSGFIYGASAVPYIHGPNLKEIIERKVGLPVAIENDANCAALAEVWKGSAKGKKEVAVVVLGTGVGGSLVKDGSIHKGKNLHAGEFGYMILNSSNLGYGMNTFSEVASTSSIIKRVALYKNVDETSLSGEKIFQLAKRGDESCVRALQEFYRMLAVGIYNIQYTYDPECILIGGGISIREDIIERLYQELEMIISRIDVATIKPEVHRCHFYGDSNLIGAVYHFLQKNV